MSDPNAPLDPSEAGREPEPPSSADQPTPPVYGAQPPVYGAQPPVYGAQPPVYGAQPPAPAYGGGYAGQPAYGYPSNSLGVWSLVLGIASFALSCGFFTGIPAIIVGNRAKTAVAEGRANNGGLATAGIVLGWIATALAVIGIIFVLFLIANGDWQMVLDDMNSNGNLNLNLT